MEFDNDNLLHVPDREGLPADDPAFAMLKKGIQLIEENRVEEALAQFEQATKFVPGSIHAWHFRGGVELSLDRLEDAAHSFQQALTLEPDNIEIQYLQAHTHFRQDLVEEAAGEFQNILEKKPDFLEAYYDCGVALQIMGRYDDAVMTFLRRLDFSPDFDTSIMCAMTYELLEDYDHAEEQYADALSLDPENTMVLESHGAVCLELERYDDAMADFQKSLLLDPESPDALYGRGHTFFCMDKTDEALADLSKVVQIDPENTLAWSMLGQVKLYLEAYDEALQCFDQALDLDPDLLIYDFRAEAKRGLGDLDGAVKELETGLEIEPENIDLLQDLADLRSERGDFAGALECLNRAMAVEPSADLFMQRGMTQMDLLNFEEAERDFTQRILREADSIESYLLRGDVRYQLGKTETALEDFRYALKLAEAQNHRKSIVRCKKIIEKILHSED
ncbi:MAG: tetratricopeptide repeat protein [Planctomycetia bacterium]|nr:tetratricopeptide repeat protein [Planctomycetia bacterium]